MSSAARCPDRNSILDSDNIPDFDNIPGLPSNVTVGFVPVGLNRSYEAMTACCSPRAVNIASDCYYWCELSTDDGFFGCLGWNKLEAGIGGLHRTSGAAGPMTGRKLVGLVAWALFVATALHL
ncbi:hypothetical protein LZ31DRAFT_556485 [Colletotrichum somersetense]|nr:hypothetical protein LZ31DRAFT_556485 [Colletotrichum somersetense]